MATRNTWRAERPFVLATLAALGLTAAAVTWVARPTPADPPARPSDAPQRVVSAAPSR